MDKENYKAKVEFFRQRRLARERQASLAPPGSPLQSSGRDKDTKMENTSTEKDLGSKVIDDKLYDRKPSRPRVPKSLATGSFDNITFNSVPSGLQAQNSTQTDSAFDLPEELKLQEWYTTLKVNGRPFDRVKHSTLMRLRHTVDKCSQDISTENRNLLFSGVRDQIHVVQLLKVDEVLVKKTRILEASLGLPKIFHHNYDKGISWPFDIKADAKSVFFKWRRHDLDPDLMRGIVDGRKAGNRYAARLDENYPNRMASNFHGNGHLVNGDWFPSQLCAVRDGAHGSSQAGIHGQSGMGAFSIVLSGSQYDDKDEGEKIVYCGTEGSNYEFTDSTSRMIESKELGYPIRVLRSHSLPKGNPYRPAGGLRYDGLYKAVALKKLDDKTQHFQFLLERLPDQDCIRFDGPWRKPTEQELAEYSKHRENIG